MGTAGTPHAWTAATLLLLAGLAGCLADDPAASEHAACQREGWTQTVVEDAGFSLCHPDDWRSTEQGPAGIDVDLALLVGQAGTGSFAANLNVLQMEVPEDMTFEEFVSANVDSLPQIITDFELTSSQRLPGDPPTHEVTYTGRQGVHDLEWRQQMVFEDPTVYVVTYTDVEGEATASEDTLDDVFASFTPT